MVADARLVIEHGARIIRPLLLVWATRCCRSAAVAFFDGSTFGQPRCRRIADRSDLHTTKCDIPAGWHISADHDTDQTDGQPRGQKGTFGGDLHATSTPKFRIPEARQDPRCGSFVSACRGVGWVPRSSRRFRSAKQLVPPNPSTAMVFRPPMREGRENRSVRSWLLCRLILLRGCQSRSLRKIVDLSSVPCRLRLAVQPGRDVPNSLQEARHS